MQAGEGTNHENSGSETLPETWESDLRVDLFDLLSSASVRLSLVQNGDHGVSWVRNNGAENTSNVTRHEGDHKLGGLAVLTLWLGEDLGVEGLDDLLESNELHNGVWDLSAPEWGKTLEETVSSLSGLNLSETLDGAGWEGSLSGCLHFNLQLKSEKQRVNNHY